MSNAAEGPRSPTPTPIDLPALLESTIPGLSMTSKLARDYLQLDVSALLSAALPLIALAAAINYIYGPVSRFVLHYGTSNVEVRDDNELFNYLMYWVYRQNHLSRSRDFLASTRTTSDQVYDSTANDEKRDTYEDDADDLIHADQDFGRVWAKLASRDKFKTLYFTPREGTHWFRYRGRFLALTRDASDRGVTRYGDKRETLTISCLGRDSRILKDLMKEAQKLYMDRDQAKTVIYRKSPYGDDWLRRMTRSPRPLSTVVLDPEQKKALLDDIREYLHPRTKRWYANRGIPYRRGYLFHGPPGTGKTSLCASVAGIFGLDIYLISLNSRAITEESLTSLFSNLPEYCVVLLEDIDAAGISDKRGVGGQMLNPPPGVSDGPSVVNDTDLTGEATGSGGITLSGLLNVIDGVASSEGRILIMTTNHVTKLDPALLRPGRVDMSIEFENANTATAEKLFCSTYISQEEDYPSATAKIESVEKASVAVPLSSTTELHRGPSLLTRSFASEDITRLAENFSKQIPSGEFSPADIQGYLLRHKLDPWAAEAGIAEWVRGSREEGVK